MHVVTKILVVFVAILAVLLSALAMAFAANADRVRGAYKNEQAARIAAETGAKNEVAQFAQERISMADRIKSLENDLSERNTRIASLQAERTTLSVEKERAIAEADAIKAQIAQLGASVDTLTQLNESYRNEVTALRDELLSSSKKEIELVDRINDLESIREVLEQNARALKEQLEEAKVALQLAQQGQTGLAAGSTEPRELLGQLIRARVTETFKNPAGDDMVVISEGANRGVKENALMHIVRGGDTFVGSVVITTVEPSRAIGRVNTYGRKDVQPLRDDIVLSRLQ